MKNAYFWGTLITATGILVLLISAGLVDWPLWPVFLIVVGIAWLIFRPKFQVALPTSQKERKGGSEIAPNYPVLALFSTLFDYLGKVLLVLGVLAGIVSAVALADSPALVIVGFAGPLLVSLVFALPMLAAKEIIRLLLSLDAQVRQLNARFDQL
ncbi:MAG: hypothetical protein M9928_12270 [Anaerolineae bacterium]|nr:hypothetical protein [Anaerolineae bacterium]MCO5198397.1 hypothetical protein [Anaerolineae bacterium]MCO5205804.1 hypothetical protein [Anaerolineae bacterium]